MNNSPSLQNLDEIYPIPEIPSDIKSAVSNEKLIVFIGAGASRVIGCLGWKELADHLVDVSFKHKLINHWEQERLRTGDPRKIISILKKVLPQPDYEKALEKSLKASRTCSKYLAKYPSLCRNMDKMVNSNIRSFAVSLTEIFLYHGKKLSSGIGEINFPPPFMNSCSRCKNSRIK